MGMNVSSGKMQEHNVGTSNLTAIMCSQASTELSAHFQLFPHVAHVLEGERQQEGKEPSWAQSPSQMHSPSAWQWEHRQLLSALLAFLIPESVQFLHF